MAKLPPIEIAITEMKENPSSGGAFMISFGISSPGKPYEMTTVHFAEEFIQQYFRIHWHKKLPEEVSRIVRGKRDLFIAWALAKLEQRLRMNVPLEKSMFDYDEDGIWADKVEKGLIKPASVKQDNLTYLFNPAKNP